MGRHAITKLHDILRQWLILLRLLDVFRYMYDKTLLAIITDKTISVNTLQSVIVNSYSFYVECEALYSMS